MRERIGNGYGMTRRGFVAGMSLGALAMAGGLAGCSQGGAAQPEPDSAEAGAGRIQPDGVMETDVLVIGGGVSGLACAVQAAQDGAKVLVVEKAPSLGGNGIGVEGIFGVNSPLQQEQGIEVNRSDVIQLEVSDSQYRSDGSLWVDLVDNSGDNIAWLQEQGVKFSGVVDNFFLGKFSTMHYFEEGTAAVGYVPHMEEAAKASGVQFMLETQASGLIFEDGAVKGAYASSESEGTIQINAKSVVLATGGIGNNTELLAKQGWGSKAEELVLAGVPSVMGDGYLMALEIGAKDNLAKSADLSFNMVDAFGFDTTVPHDDPLNATMGIAAGGPVLWVNQDARRFVNEGLSYDDMSLQSCSIKGNRATYAIFSQDILDTFAAGSELEGQKLADALERDAGQSVFSAETVSELAGHFGLDASSLEATVARYEKFCAEGKDEDFGKDPSFLRPFAQGPFYIAKLNTINMATLGALATNCRGEVLGGDITAIPGLYASGLDGIMLYSNVYAISVPGACCGNQVNSGRSAGRSAAAYAKSS